MEFQERNIEGVTVLTVERGLRGALATVLKDRIDELVGEGRLYIVVNLKQVPQIDSRDIGRIIRAHLSVRQAGGRVRLCHLSERVLSVLKMTHLDTVLEIHDTEREAIEGLVVGKGAGPVAGDSLPA